MSYRTAAVCKSATKNSGSMAAAESIEEKLVVIGLLTISVIVYHHTADHEAGTLGLLT